MRGICPTPHGVGGLKYMIVPALGDIALSHPARGGWIEITPAPCTTGLLGPTPHGVGGLK